MIKRFFQITFFLFFLGSVVFSGFVIATLYDLKGISSLETYKPPTVSKILDINGDLIAEFYKERRKIVSLNEISPYLIQATLATEDKRFNSHYGVDPIRILKALFVNLMSLTKEQGGSTITIQLSKLIFLNHEKTFTRKIIELWYAFQIEAQYSKEEILNFYFNQINYGHGAYGVEAAANFFFNKKAKDLDLAEAALLAAIPKSPVYYSPIRYPENSMRRHRVVLLAMVNNGYITEEQAFASYKKFWDNFGKKTRKQQASFSEGTVNNAPYFTEYIRAKVSQDLKEDKVYEAGINIYTTLNLKHQKLAQKFLWDKLEEQDKVNAFNERTIINNLPYSTIESLGLLGGAFNLEGINLIDAFFKKKAIKEYSKLKESLKLIFGNFGLTELTDLTYIDLEDETNLKEKAQGAVIAINPQNGYITTMVGGSPFSFYNQFNRSILIRRQAGSTIKTFIYAVAIEKDILTASTLLNDSPLLFGEYIPKNYDNFYRGPILVRDALKKSVNVLAVETLDKIGITEAQESLANIFQVSTAKSQKEKFPDDLTLALGSGGFSPLDVATAYAVLANNGKEVIPKTIRYISDNNGKVIKNYQEEYDTYTEDQLLSAETVFIIKNIIKDVFSPGGTAYIPDLLKDFSHKSTSFGKTGTTSNWNDAWFAGANAYLSTVVWVGYDDNRSLGRGRTGGRVSAPVWINFQKNVLKNREPLPFISPPNIIAKSICRTSGELAGPDCPRHLVYKEYYKDTFNPSEEDTTITQQKKAEEERFLNAFFGEAEKEEKLMDLADFSFTEVNTDESELVENELVEVIVTEEIISPINNQISNQITNQF